MDKRDYIELIRVGDVLDRMDEALQILTGYGHEEGRIMDLDKVYDVLQRNSKYSNEDDDHISEQFFAIVSDKSRSVEERAGLLMREE